MSSLTINLLGPLEVRAGERAIDLPRGRARALAIALALSAGRPVAVETLAERVWGDRLPVDARASLHTLVRRLRGVLGPEAISSGGGGYTLNVPPDNVDALRFERLLDGEAPDLRVLREAVSLWRGGPAEQHLSDWLTSYEGPRLAERYLAAVERRIDLELAGPVSGDLVRELREVIERHPLRESLWLRLLRVLSACGRPAEALTAYETLRRRLADELGIDPSPELRGLYAELLAGTADPVRPARVVPQQLPADVDSLAGRAEALLSLENLAAAGRLVVVHGTGGIGKTSLVVHWAHRARDRFPDGQLFVDLRGFGPDAPVEPAAALAGMLSGLGVAAERIPEGSDARTALLRTTLAERRALVVLDNARDAEQVRPLLPGAGATVIVTSRNELRGLAAREHARRIGLDLLAPADATAMLAERLGMLSVGRDEESLATLAAQCGYLPLALTVAAERAGRYPQWPLRDMVEQLASERDRLDLLDAGEDLTTSLRAVMLWSYQALTPDAARLFRLLGVCPGTEISAPAAAALAGGDMRRLLDRLAETHLLSQPRPGRYAMHDLTRVYATELAAGDPDRDDALRRLCNWYAWSAANAISTIRGKFSTYGAVADGVVPAEFESVRHALAWFAAEHDALLAVTPLAFDLEQYHEVIQLSRVLAKYAELATYSAGPIDALGLEAARAVGDELAEAQVLNSMGVSHALREELDVAVDLFARSLALHRKLAQPIGECLLLGNLGRAYRSQGRLNDSTRVSEQALELSRARGLPLYASAALHNLAGIHVDEGRHQAAITAATAAVREFSGTDMIIERALALDDLGSICLTCGEHSRAAEAHGEALRIHREVGAHWNEAYALTGLGRAHHGLGDVDAALSCWQDALRILDEIGAEDNTELSRADLRKLIADLASDSDGEHRSGW